jgi:hypothetical protein
VWKKVYVSLHVSSYELVFANMDLMFGNVNYVFANMDLMFGNVILIFELIFVELIYELVFVYVIILCIRSV